MKASSSFAIWLDAARPKTLPLAVASIVCGSAVAAWHGSFSAAISLLALLTALLLQILSNLANDYGDTVKGTDNDNRLGPQRAIQSGLVTPNAMRKAMGLNIVLTAISGLSLIYIACDNAHEMFGFLLLGLMAIAASIAYTVGNKPYGYQGLGDLSVLMFFGWLGVAGTYYLQAGQIDSVVMLPATACGLLAVGVLNINNLRDIDNDRECGKLTLAVRMGPLWGRKYHLFLLAGSVLCMALFALFELHSPFGWLFILSTPLLFKHGKQVFQSTDGAALRPMMATMVKCALITNLLFAAGLILATA
ncbi:1,4-dihydroxy-2-naphthoate octaprenyltransferase [Photobacterium damselae subsp. piscicida]|uniref:1,4-dihydroxy-2-naphthoate octaprenyltransferase n=1 Tax=Photobacterium damsela subsp. piscicida TaxID=38294 RepID=L7NJV6_PHODP|nr:1,4-dihydroxy-2-naphthoate polyprenyltransferase [Photobacterium damselae]AEU09893.1 1,4-dihydroxy-2-naphthoate octaprenyltransferase [Photobacterium damselae subsp. piscicida]MBE8128131.1 1,4-dihydroxy-2-naphthoate polyprenyltransferase [Photobacterium damselae subsp. piscicida]MDP2515820.1 1,4-dihydroxy-2-naphthoate polyprenyltransferase [Photobacterium damselae subsp. piscicida]MDP2533566.1 1,4-dihydroxy-2-naphthoate polyprenyltransferase [Photobacterium damselae subsp. piscicida]MDP2545